MASLAGILRAHHLKAQRVESLKNEIRFRDERIVSANEILHARSEMVNDLAQLFDTISAERALITDYLFSIRSGAVPYSAEDLKSHIHSFSTSLVNLVREVFEIYTRDRCGCCIKFVGTIHGVKSIIATLRDDSSRNVRSEVDARLRNYPYHENSAFRAILSPYDPRTYFVFNDLKNLADYANANSQWNKFYNATAVVPITRPRSNDQVDIIGFLCVDNRLGEFDEKFTIGILRSFSHILYNVLTEQFEIGKVMAVAGLPKLEERPLLIEKGPHQ